MVTHTGPLTLFHILQQMLQQRRTLQEHLGVSKEVCDVRLALQLTLQHPYTATHTATLIHCNSHCNSHCNTHTLQLTLQHSYTTTHTATFMLSLRSSFFIAAFCNSVICLMCASVSLSAICYLQLRNSCCCTVTRSIVD